MRLTLPKVEKRVGRDSGQEPLVHLRKEVEFIKVLDTQIIFSEH